MTTRRQIEANRRNARKSTGPRSAEGRVRAARNARRHGLTASPDWAVIVRWFKIITGDIEALPDPLTTDESERASLRLAEAEAQLERARQVEEEHLGLMHEQALKSGRRSEDETLEAGPEDARALAQTLEECTEIKAMLQILLDASPDRPAALKQKLATLSRYRREAEARRHKALDHWISTGAK